MVISVNQCGLIGTQELGGSNSFSEWKLCILRWTTETVMIKLKQNITN